MSLRAITFDKSTSVGRLQQELFRSYRNQRSTGSIVCSKCSLQFAVFFPNIDDSENVTYIKTLEKKISDDCAAGRHAAEYTLNMTPESNLEAIRAQKRQRAFERNAEPQGISRWLLFYRPEGFDGFLIQSFYYSLLLAIIMMAIAAPIVVIMSRELAAGLFILLFIPLCVLFALYLRNVSLRLKSVGNAARLKSSKQPNCDISWLRRNLLIFKKGEKFWGLRAFYYLLLFDAVYTPVRPPEGITFFSSVLYSGGMLLFAQIFRVDALSRRAKTYLSSQFASNADVEPRSVDVGSDDVKEVGKSKRIA